MLEIRVDSRILILKPDTKIRVEFNAPYFETESIPAPLVWNFDLPIAGNEETFKYSHHVIMKNNYKVYNCQIALHGYPLGVGKLVLTNAGAVYRVIITLNGFANDFEGINLNNQKDSVVQIGTTQEEILAHVQYMNRSNIHYHLVDHLPVVDKDDDIDYCFPVIYAPNWYGDVDENGAPKNNPNYQGYINNYSRDNRILSTGQTPLVNSDDMNINSLSPQFRLRPMLRRILKQQGYSAKGGIFDDIKSLSDFRYDRLITHNNRSLDIKINGYKVKAGIIADKTLDPIEVIYEQDGETIQTYSNFKRIAFDTTDIDETGTFSKGVYKTQIAGTYELSGVIEFAQNWNSGYFYGRCFKLQVVSSLETKEIIFENQCDEFVVDLGTAFGTIQATYPDTITIIANSFWAQNPSQTWPNNGLAPLYVKNTSLITIDIYSDKTNSHQTAIDYNNHLPTVPVTTVLNTIRNLFGDAIFFDTDSKAIELLSLNDVLDDAHNALDITAMVVESSEDTAFNDETTLSYKFNCSDVGEYDKISYQRLKSKLNYPLTDGLPLDAPKSGMYGLSLDEQTIYVSERLANSTEVKWNFFSHNFHPTVGKDEVKLDAQPMLMTTEIFKYLEYDENPANNDYKYPDVTLTHYREKGVTPFNGDEKVEEMPLTLSFYMGYCLYANTNIIIGENIYYGYTLSAPLASSQAWKSRAATDGIVSYWDFNDSLSFDDTAINNIYNTFLKRWCAWVKTTTTTRVQLTNVDVWQMIELLNLLKPSRATKNKRWIRYKSVHFLPEQMSFIINVQGNIEDAEIIMRKKSNDG